MKEQTMRGIVKTMMDGVKDAHMQYEYAVEAKKHGDNEIAEYHIEEARQRITGAKVWRERAHKHYGEVTDPLATAMEAEWCEWFRSVEAEINAFKEL